MQAEQILFAQFNSVGEMIVMQSPNVDKWLLEKSIREIMDLGRQIRKETLMIQKFASEQVVAYTLLKPVKDKDGRESMLNHTILLKYDSVFSDQKAKIREHFYTGETKPEKLETLKL